MHNVGSTRVAEFDFLTKERLGGGVGGGATGQLLES